MKTDSQQSEPVAKPGAQGTLAATHGSEVATDNYVLSRQIMDGLVTIRNISDDGSTVANLTDAEMANLVGIIRFATAVGGDLTAGAVGNAIYHGVDITGAYQTPIGTKVASRSLYGVTVVQNTYTPIASEVLTFTLWVE